MRGGIGFGDVSDSGIVRKEGSNTVSFVVRGSVWLRTAFKEDGGRSDGDQRKKGGCDTAHRIRATAGKGHGSKINDSSINRVTVISASWLRNRAAYRQQ